MKRTHSCEPTMTDEDVVWFCRNGYWILEGVVPDDINQRSMDYLSSHAGHQSEPTENFCRSHVLPCSHSSTGTIG